MSNTEDIIRQLTVLQLKNRELKKKHDVSLPLKRYLKYIERNLEKEEKETLVSRINHLKKNIDVYHEVLSIDLHLIDIKGSIRVSKSFKEIKKKVKSDIDSAITHYKGWLKWLKSLEIESSELTSMLEDIESSDDIKYMLQTIEDFENRVVVICESNKEKIEQKIWEYEDIRNDLKERGVEGESIDTLKNQLRSIVKYLKKDMYLDVLCSVRVLDEELEHLSSIHKKFKSWLNILTRLLDDKELPEEDEHRIRGLIEDIKRSDEDFNIRIEKLQDIQDEIVHKEKKAEDLIKKIENRISDDAFLQELSKNVGVVGHLSGMFKRGNIKQVLVEGERLLNRMIDLKERYESVCRSSEEVKDLWNTVGRPFHEISELKEELRAVEDELDMTEFIGGGSATLDDFYRMYGERLERIEDDLTSIQERFSHAVEEKRKEAVTSIEDAKAHLKRYEEKLPDLDLKYDIERAEDCVEDDRLLEGIELADSIVSRIDKAVKLQENEEEIRRIYSNVSPLTEQIENVDLLDKIARLENTVHEGRFDDEDLLIAMDIEKEIEDIISDKIGRIRNIIQERSGAELNLEGCLVSLRGAEDRMLDGEYVSAIELCDEAQLHLDETLSVYEEFNSFSEGLGSELEKLQRYPIDVDDLRSELDSVYDLTDYSERVENLHTIEEKLKDRFKKRAKDLLLSINVQREQLIDYEEKNVKFGTVWEGLEGPYDQINEIKSLDSQEEWFKILEAENTFKDTKESIDEIIRTYNDLMDTFDRVQKLMARAKNLGISVGEFEKNLPNLAEESLDLFVMNEKTDGLELIEERLYSEYEAFRDELQNDLEGIGKRVDDYKKKKCYFNFFTDQYTTVSEHIEEGRYEDALIELEKLTKKVDERINSFDEAKKKEDDLISILEKLEETNIDHDIKRSSLFSYKDYEKANKDYKNIMKDLVNKITNYGDKLDETLAELDDILADLVKDSHFHPLEAVEQIKKAIELSNEGKKITDEVTTVYICPDCDEEVSKWSLKCSYCGVEFQDDDLSDDILILLDTWIKIEKIILDIEEEIDDFDNNKNRLNRNIDEIQDIIAQLERSEIELNDIIEEVYSLTEEKNIKVAVERSEEIRKTCNVVIDEYVTRTEEEIQEAKELFQNKINNGIAIDSAREILDNAIENKEKKLFVKAIRQAQESKNLAERIEGKYKESKEVEELLKTKIDVCFKKGLYPIEHAVEFERIRFIKDYSDKIERAKATLRKLEMEEREKQEEIKEKLNFISSFLEELEAEGVNTNKAKRCLDEAKAKAERYEVNLSLNKAVEACKLGLELKEGYERAKSTLMDTKRKLKAYDDMGINVEDIELDIEKLEERGRYDLLITKCVDIQSDLDIRKNDIEKEIADRIVDIERYISRLDNLGLDTEPFLEDLETVDDEFQRGDYGACIAIMNDTVELMKKRETQYGKFVTLKEECNDLLSHAKEAGLDIDYDEIVQNIHQLKNSNDYAYAISELGDISSGINEKIEEKRSEASRKLKTLDSLLQDLKDKGRYVGVETRIPELERGRHHLDAGRYGDAKKQFEMGLKKCEEIEKDLSKLKMYLNIVYMLIDAQRGKGIDVKYLEDQIAGVKTSVVGYPYMDDKIRHLEKILKEHDKEVKVTIKNIFDGELKKLNHKRKEEDLKSEELESQIEDLISELDKWDITKCVDRLYDLNSSISSVHQEHEEFLAKKEKIAGWERDLNMISIDTIDIEHYFDMADSSEEYDTAFEVLDEAAKLVLDEVDSYFEEKENFLEDIDDLLSDIKESSFSKDMSDDILNLERDIEKSVCFLNEKDVNKLSNIIEGVEENFEILKSKYAHKLLDHVEDVNEIIRKIERSEVPSSELCSTRDEILESIKRGDMVGIHPRVEELKERTLDIKEKIGKRDDVIKSVEKHLESAVDIGMDKIQGRYRSELEELKEEEDIDLVIGSLKEMERDIQEEKETWINEKKKQFVELKKRADNVPASYLDPDIKVLEKKLEEIFYADFYEGVGELIKEYRSLIEGCEEVWETMIARIKLPFTHGIETELQIVNEDGKWIEGKKMKAIFDYLISEANDFVSRKIENKEVPDYILEKVDDVSIKEDKAENEAVHIKYEIVGKKEWFSIIGKDSHVTTTTNILEIQTPPCQYLKELEWWLKTVFEASYEAVKRSGTGLLLISTGMNPIKGFSKGVTFGDHHHIGIPDESTRRAVYNVLRNYIPHIISLSVNSPFPGGDVPEIKRNQNNSLISPMTSLSLRIENNIGQLACPPMLEDSDNKDRYLEKISPDEESSRMVDICPFTRFDTIEIRISDTELSLSDRLSLAVLIQAIAMKAKKMLDSDSIPKSIPENTLLNMRENAYKHGLLFPLSTIRLEEYYPEFKSNIDILDNGTKPNIMKDVCITTVYWLKDELSELKLLESHYVDPLFIKLFGPKSSARIGAPITSAQYQLYLLTHANENLQNLLILLDEISSKCAANVNYHPMIDMFGYPDVPKGLLPTKMNLTLESCEISYLHDDKIKLNTIISLNNVSGDKMKDVHVHCRYLSDDERDIEEEEIDIPIFEKNIEERLVFENIFDDGEPPTEISLEAFEEGERLISRKHPIPSQESVSINVSFTGPKIIYGGEKEIEIPYSIEIKNLREDVIDGVMKIFIEDEDGEKGHEIIKKVEVKKRETYAAVLDITSDWALNALEHQTYRKLEPLVIKFDDDRQRFRIKVKLDLGKTSVVSKESDAFEIIA